jgi:hypothetical protein
VNILRRSIALGFIGRESLAAEGWSMRIEGYSDVGRLLFLKYFVQRIAEADDGAGILTLGVDTRVLDKRIIGTINERVGV